MIPVAFLLAPRGRLLAGIVLLLALLSGRLSLATAPSETTVDERAIATVLTAWGDNRVLAFSDDSQWSAAPIQASHEARGLQWPLPLVRVVLTFGDSTWDAIVADQATAVVTAGRRWDFAQAASSAAPSWATLHVRNVRLQI
jgi:hypothetical protein